MFGVCFVIILSLLQLLHAQTISTEGVDFLSPSTQATSSLDLSIYNRDEKFYLIVRTEDGTQVCADTFTRDERTKCRYDVTILKHGWNKFHITIYSLDQQEVIYQTVKEFHYDAKQSIARSNAPPVSFTTIGNLIDFTREHRGLLLKFLALLILARGSGRGWLLLYSFLQSLRREPAKSDVVLQNPSSSSPPPLPPNEPQIMDDEEDEEIIQMPLTSSVSSVHSKIYGSRNFRRYAAFLIGAIAFRFLFFQSRKNEDEECHTFEPINTSPLESSNEMKYHTEDHYPIELNLAINEPSHSGAEPTHSIAGLMLLLSDKLEVIIAPLKKFAPKLRTFALKVIELELVVVNTFGKYLKGIQQMEEKGIEMLVFSILHTLEGIHFVMSRFKPTSQQD